MNMKKVDKTQCKKCLYRPPETAMRNFGCFYILYTGRKRPCDPSPNCTVFKKNTKKERAELAKTIKQLG